MYSRMPVNLFFPSLVGYLCPVFSRYGWRLVFLLFQVWLDTGSLVCSRYGYILMRSRGWENGPSITGSVDWLHTYWNRESGTKPRDQYTCCILPSLQPIVLYSVHVFMYPTLTPAYSTVQCTRIHVPYLHSSL